MSRTALLTHADCALHEISPGHPEQPARLAAILDQLESDGLLSSLSRVEVQEADRDHLILAHPKEYVDAIINASPASGSVQLDADTAMNEHSLRAAMLAVGAGVKSVELVLDDEYDNTFCCVRPPGHHAEETTAMGFCFFGSIAIAALYALQKPGIDKVAIIDFDVHHGNGTEDLIGEHPDIFFCSSFQHPLYPGKFGKNVPGRKINIPLGAGSDGATFKEKMQADCLPALKKFKPDMVFISAGFDAHRDDPLAGLNLLEEDFAWITAELKAVADESSNGRLVSMLEGGYDLPALGRSASAHVKELLK